MYMKEIKMTDEIVYEILGRLSKKDLKPKAL